MTLTKSDDLSSKDLLHLSDHDVRLLKTYTPKHKIRFVTATSLFDGHDASINIMRRLLQARGAEVIHLGHNRSAQEIVDAAVQEDAQAIAVSCYQGGHAELFPYIRQLLDEQACPEVRIFGGGGGVVSPSEITHIESNGTYKIYSPEDGQKIGLDGIIGHVLYNSDFVFNDWAQRKQKRTSYMARALTLMESGKSTADMLSLTESKKKIPVLGVTGTGGAGKSSLVDELLLRFIEDNPKLRIAVICVDPSKKKTGGALLGDRLRINAATRPQIFLRSFATRESGRELNQICKEAIRLFKSQDFDLIVVETSGIGQGDTGIIEVSDLSLYVMTPEFGAQTQLEKIDMLDFANFIAVNKFERPQGLDAVDQVRTLLRRSRHAGSREKLDELPVFGTIASRFADDGVSGLYYAIMDELKKLSPSFVSSSIVRPHARSSTNREAFIPHKRTQYLSEIVDAVRLFHSKGLDNFSLIQEAEALERAGQICKKETAFDQPELLLKLAQDRYSGVDATLHKQIQTWPQTHKEYAQDHVTFKVRGKDVKVSSTFKTLSSDHLPRVALPNYTSKTEIARFLWKENLPGYFPYTAGIFPFRRKEEEPKRQFAGEGGPKRTNARFHYLANHDPAKRLSTAFDSVTLYGADPDRRPDIYGKVGESGVSIAQLEDMKDLYRGFDLCHPTTSVSMTINGPAPIILAMFFNAAIDQQVEHYRETEGKDPDAETYSSLFDQTLHRVRGTVQADILKEDQAQNTCIFSTEFALKLMGDMQEYFIQKSIRNFYSVSISGYHIAEAGANPITQLAFTLANGFTYLEYYLGRGMPIDKIAPNLSFFFSNGIDAEYAVIGRVARRIWAIAMRDVYGGNESSQRLKYHIQTSGRSLHAQEMAFNDIRTTLQALMAIYDNCNSLHTNAYDEALTTPTEESVRRAMAIQLIINREFGLNQCENVNQGSYFIEELTDLVEEAVLKEFEAISRRGGVLGAMESQYQRTKIQEESIYYETLKHTGEIPIVGVNTFTSQKVIDLANRAEITLTRASYDEKDEQLKRLKDFQSKNRKHSQEALSELKNCILQGKNIFAELMNTVRHCTLGEISETLYEMGGKYRRAM
jgi:methylmalonyl-CoA mutase